MRSQNPLKPYDNQEFATQLAQFSQLEQLSDIKGLNRRSIKILLCNESNNVECSAYLECLGKSATAITSHVNIEEGESINLGYILDSQFSNGEIEIRNEFGSVVRNIPLG